MTKLQNLRNSIIFLLYWMVFLGDAELTNPESRNKDSPLGTPTLIVEQGLSPTGQVSRHSSSKGG